MVGTRRHIKNHRRKTRVGKNKGRKRRAGFNGTPAASAQPTVNPYVAPKPKKSILETIQHHVNKAVSKVTEVTKGAYEDAKKTTNKAVSDARGAVTGKSTPAPRPPPPPAPTTNPTVGGRRKKRKTLKRKGRKGRKQRKTRR